MTTLQGFLSFAESAKHASFARAARALELSPSAVAKSVARLETALGVRLFHRTTRQVVLTSDGRELYQRCQRVLEEIDGLRSAAEGARASPRGTLRLDMPVCYGKRVMVPLLAKLAARHPELGFEVRFSDRYADLVQDGLDAVIRVGALRDSRLVSRVFDAQQLVICASGDYLKRKGTPRSIAELARHDCLGNRNPTTGRERAWPVRAGRAGRDVVPPSRIVFDDGEALVQAAIEGLGLVQLPSYFFGEALRDGRLVEVLARFRPPPEPVSIVYPSRRQMAQRLRVLIDALVALRPSAG
jgi:LysR family transcriptional regulator, regulator for bpeEF and oprC